MVHGVKQITRHVQKPRAAAGRLAHSCSGAEPAPVHEGASEAAMSFRKCRIEVQRALVAGDGRVELAEAALHVAEIAVGFPPGRA